MGIDFAQIPFFDASHKQSGIGSPVLGLGSLVIRESREQIQEFANKWGYASLQQEHSIRALFCDRYGVREYRDCDMNGSADIKLNLNERLPKSLVGMYGSVLNGGTLEHVFDIRQAMENLHDLIRPGGSFIHMVPLTWYDHGFVNFNPILFQTVAQANQYSILAEGFYFLTGMSPEDPERPAVVVTHGGTDDRRARELVKAKLSGRELPKNMMYLVTLRKNRPDKFVMPYLVSD